MPIQIPVTQTGFEASIQAAAQKAGRNLKIDLGSSARSINALSQPLGRITGQADEFTKSMEAANARVLAFGASVGVLNSVIQGFKSLVTTTIEVEKSLADINSVLQGSSAELNKFKKDIFDVARETGNSFKTVSEAALELSRQGLPANEVVGRLKDSMILARLSGLDAAQSVEGLTAAINSFSKEGLTSSQILNKISNAAAKYAVSERDLIEGFKRSASVAQQAGVSIDELGGIITAVQQKSARGGAVIGNSFKTIFTRIQRPESLKLLEEIGVQVLDLKGNIVPATKLLEGLASKISSLDDVQVTSITEKIGGGFQIAPLLSALDDYNSKTSVARGATEAFMSATNQAYERNAALNQTMAAAINEASVNLKEFANTLGEIGVTKGLSNVLSFFNTFISDVQGLLEGEGLGSKFARSIVEGIGNVLSGPGLAVFGGIILKLTTDLVKFGTESLKTFFNIGGAAKEINALQGSIASTLLKNKDIQTQILALEGNRAAQARFFTAALNEQYSTMQKMQGIAASIAPAVYGGTRGTRGGTSKNAAGGYIPAVSQETRDISRGVGGAKAGDKPVVIPNFAFGGGKKGTMVAHTGEFIVPNFAAGGSAIFNRDMVRSMGLPAGAKKIGAAGGFIPNFVQARSSSIPPNTSPNILRRYAAYQGDDPTSKQRAANAQKILDEKIAKQQTKEQSRLVLDASKFALLIPTIGASNQNGENFSGSFKKGSSSIPYELKNLKIRGPQVPKAIDQAADPNDEYLKNNIENSIASDSAKYANLLGKPAKKITKVDVLRLFETNKGAKGAISSAVGAGFEAATMAAIKTSNFSDDIAAKLNKAGGDFDVRGATDDINTLFGLKSIRTMDFKSSRSSGNIDSFAKKLYNELPAALSAKVSKAAGGFIPNFANPLKEAINREMSAGVPASQIYVDQNSSLKNSMNPMGLMVANRRDEPAGGIQGINRARREGANPMLYGASKGFVPNYAPQLGEVSRSDVGKTKISDQAIIDFNNSLKGISDQLRKGSISFADANLKVDQLAKSTGSTQTQVIKLGAAGQGLITAYNNELQARNQKAQELKQQRATTRQSKNSDSKEPRDTLGTLFAVQAGLSLLTGATNDSASAVVKFTNIVSQGAGTFTTAMFAIQGLAGMGGRLGAVFSKLGPYGIAAAATFSAFQVAGGLIDEFSGANKLAAENSAKLAKAAGEAAVKLEDLDPVKQQKVKQTSANFLYNLQNRQINLETGQYVKPENRYTGGGADVVLNITDEEEQNLAKAIEIATLKGATEAQIAKIFTDNLKQNLSTTGIWKEEASKIQQALLGIKGIDEEALKQQLFGSYDLEKLKQVQSNYDEINKLANANGTTVFTINRLLEDQINLVEQKLKTEKKSNEDQEKALSQALQASLKKSALERPTKIMQQAGSLMESSLEISTKQKLLQINGDLSLSEDLRKRKLEEINHQYEISKIGLQSQLKLAEKLDSSLQEISSGKVLGIDPKQGTEQARSFIQRFVSNTANKDTLERLAAGESSPEFINQLRSQVKNEAPLFQTAGQQDQLITLAKEYYELEQGISIETAQQKNEKQKLYEISQKELSIEKQRQNLIERGNLYLKGAQNKLTSRIEDISNQSILNEAQKELELTIFDKTGKTVDPEENARAIEAINQKYFELQQQLNAEKAEAELRLEITRNLKIDNNITSLGANTTAVGSVKDALINNVLPVLNTLPKNMADELKNAVLALNNGGQPVPQTGQTTSGAGGTIGMPYRANVNSDVKSLLDLVSQKISSDPKYLAAVYGNVMKESGGIPITEASDYSNTDNQRIRSIFGSRVANMSDATLSNLKKDPMFLGKMYGPDYQIGKNLGNTSIEEGMKYRGRGYVQITGKTAYKQAGEAIGEDLLRNPDLASDPEIAKKIAVWMLEQRKNQFTGGGFNKLLLQGDQSQINKAVTSQFAGQSADSGYLGSLLTKVNDFANKWLKGSSDLGGSLDNTSKNFLQASGYLQKTSSTAQASVDNLKLDLAGRDRNKKPNDDLQNKIRQIVKEVYGPEAIATIYSGMGKTPGGSRRHEGGKAADIFVEINGKKVTGEELAKLGAAWVTKGMGSAGYGMDANGTANSGIHLDTFTKDQLIAGEGLSWGYGGGEGALLKKLIMDKGGYPSGSGATGISASALANKTLSQVDPIRQAAQRVSGFEIGDSMTNAAIAEATKLVDKNGKTTEEATAQINEMAKTIEAAAMSIISNGKTATTAAEQNRINIEKARAAAQPGTFASGFTTGMENLNKEIAGFSEQIGEKIPSLFADNMANAMEDIILNSEDLETSLRSAATAFLTEINRSNFKNLANIFTSGVQQVGSSIFSSFASGGPITGGSGTKDDVPALLMGGEFVMNKKSVSKYGMNFMNQLNNGSLPKFADGGSVSDISKVGKYTIFSGKTGSSVSGEYSEDGIPRQYDQEGRFFSPGTYGSGAIIGKNDLLKFATQSQTPGKNDIMVNQNGLSYVSLEPESTRLTVEGRLNSPEFQAVQRDKEEALSLYLQQYNQEQQAEEDYKAQKKAFRKQLVTALISTVATAGIKAIAGPALAGFQAGMGQASSQGLTGLQAFGSGVQGIWSGGNIGGTQIGGLSNFFSGNMELANIGTASQLSSLFQKDPNSNLSKLIASNASNYISNISVPKAIPVNRATGGLIPNTSGVDTVPAMLSGGEFVMNRAATQNIGVGTLQSLNAGGSSDSQSQNSTENTDKIVSKLDELITAIKENMSGNVSVNVSSDGSSTKETTDNSKENDSSQSNSALAKRIKAAVIEVIQQEKRLGGSLRTT